jgi:hypothetical protein
VFDTGPMQSRAEFLKGLGEDLARFEAPRVARLGCITGLVVAAAASVAGYHLVQTLFPGLFRLVTLSLLGTVLLVFAVFATLEAGAERRARRKVGDFLQSGSADMKTLLEMARVRKGRFPGSEKVIDLLEQMTGSGGPAS